MRRLSFAFAVVLLITASSRAADMPLKDSMLYADSLWTVLGLPATHVEFVTAAALSKQPGTFQSHFDDWQKNEGRRI